VIDLRPDHGATVRSATLLGGCPFTADKRKESAPDSTFEISRTWGLEQDPSRVQLIDAK